MLMRPTAGRWGAQAEDQGDSVTFMFESATQERVSDFELKLMDIDSEQCAPLLWPPPAFGSTSYTQRLRCPCAIAGTCKGKVP